MNDALKKVLSKRAMVAVLVALLILSGFNTYLIFEGTRSSMSTNALNYDYVLSKDGENYKLKNMLTGYVAEQADSASSAINSALNKGKSVYLNPGTYVLTDDIVFSNKVNAKIVGDNQATIIGNRHKIIVYGKDYTTSQNVLISGLTLVNATIRVENSFGTIIQKTIFENTSTGIEFANTNTWSEYNKVEDCQFINATEGIAFRTPVFSLAEETASQAVRPINATGSYSSTIIERCSFNLRDFSVGIKVEKLAELSDSQIQDVRFWIGENGRANQTGIYVDGSMYQTLLIGVVFESFTSDPVYLFGIDVGDNCNPTPILDSGISFLGNWTAKIHDIQGIWLSGDDTLFKQEGINVAIGTNNQYGQNQSLQIRPLIISSFKPKIAVTGSFRNNETITVQVRIEYIDNAISVSVEHTFTNSSSVWLSDDDMMRLFPSQSIIWAIMFNAKTNSDSTDAIVTVSGYGTAG
ncbi:MAG TPA: hypothetical protein VK253_07090 [Candidatus Binatia bacterium]|nr:hypothetical protein [Candidatus Binatia bacterium]